MDEKARFNVVYMEEAISFLESLEEKAKAEELRKLYFKSKKQLWKR